MKRFILLLLCFLLCAVTAFSAGAAFNSEDFTKNLYSQAYYVQSLDNDAVMFSKNEKEKRQPAAFAKLMAALVAVEQWGDLTESVQVTQQSLSLVGYDFGVRTAGLTAGESYTRRQLVDCLVVYSANDVLSVIAHSVSGTAEEFINQMNEKARAIGMENTHFVDMCGFDAEGQYTTAEDVAILIRHALEYPAFAEAFSATECVMPETEHNAERTYNGSNRMMTASIADYYHRSVTGGKQTTTDEAGECIAVVSNFDGYSYITVVLGGTIENIDDDEPEENTCMTDAQRLLTWLYNNIRFRVVASPEQIAYSIAIKSARDVDFLQLAAKDEVSVLVPSNVSTDSVLIEPIEDTVPENLTAPVNQGDVICKANIIYANEVLATVDLVAAQTVKISVTGWVMGAVLAVIKSPIFLCLEVIAFIVVLVCIIIEIKRQRDRKKSKMPRIVEKQPEKNEDQSEGS